MTEDDARQRWCPFARIFNGGTATNRMVTGEPAPASHCLGHGCMAWRWQPLAVDNAYLEAVKRATAEAKEAGTFVNLAAAKVNANRAAYGLPERSTEGYCGLAGKPAE